MANYFTHFAFKMAATRAEAECLVAAITAATAIENGEPPPLPPEIEAAFRSDTQRGEEVFTEIIGDLSLGIDCLFEEGQGSLTIFDTDGAPNLWAFAKCLQRLFPEKLPFGFVYGDSCDKSRPGGFGGGYFLITQDTVSHESLDQILAAELADLEASSDGR